MTQNVESTVRELNSTLMVDKEKNKSYNGSEINKMETVSLSILLGNENNVENQ